MYKPVFTITSAILKSIGQIENAKAVIETSPLLPLYEREFKKDALVRSLHFGTALEGNKLDFGNVKKIIDGKGEEVVGRERDIQEVLNYRKVINFIGDYKAKNITEETILKINSITTEKLVEENGRGKYRTVQNYFVNFLTGERLFTPTDPKSVKKEMANFIDFINSDEALELHPAIKSAIVHDRIVSIHPFVDGNGRSARACATLSLYIDGYDIRKFFSLEEYYDGNILDYYKAIEGGHKDLTLWIDYFTRGLAIELNRIKERVLKMSRDAKIKDKVGQIFLSERQEKIIEWLNSYTLIQNKDFIKMFPDISEDSVLRDIKYLMDNKIVVKRGKTKSARYELK